MILFIYATFKRKMQLSFIAQLAHKSCLLTWTPPPAPPMASISMRLPRACMLGHGSVHISCNCSDSLGSAVSQETSPHLATTNVVFALYRPAKFGSLTKMEGAFRGFKQSELACLEAWRIRKVVPMQEAQIDSTLESSYPHIPHSTPSASSA